MEVIFIIQDFMRDIGNKRPTYDIYQFGESV
jgi:hypothetical protein